VIPGKIGQSNNKLTTAAVSGGKSFNTRYATVEV